MIMEVLLIDEEHAYGPFSNAEDAAIWSDSHRTVGELRLVRLYVPPARATKETAHHCGDVVQGVL